jgi:hypothetical protein
MGMPFSQEIKIEAYMRGFSCGETDITYKKRQGSSKLHIIRDGMGNLNSMVSKRISYGLSGPKNTENLLQSNPELSTEELNQDG